MNRATHTFVLGLAVVLIAGSARIAAAQSTSQPTGQKTLAATLNVYVFPAEGQTTEQQSMDEAACYNWAVQNTGSDPFDLQKQAQQQTQQTERAKQQAKSVGSGAGAQGAVRGAAAGALIGAIAGDTGKGAAWGAGLGAVSGASQGAAAREQAKAQAARQGQSAQQTIAQQQENFIKAFTVCLEAKDYMVKY